MREEYIIIIIALCRFILIPGSTGTALAYQPVCSFLALLL